jgi:hypothetical protein
MKALYSLQTRCGVRDAAGERAVGTKRPTERLRGGHAHADAHADAHVSREILFKCKCAWGDIDAPSVAVGTTSVMGRSSSTNCSTGRTTWAGPAPSVLRVCDLQTLGRTWSGKRKRSSTALDGAHATSTHSPHTTLARPTRSIKTHSRPNSHRFILLRGHIGRTFAATLDGPSRPHWTDHRGHIDQDGREGVDHAAACPWGARAEARSWATLGH